MYKRIWSSFHKHIHRIHFFRSSVFYFHFFSDCPVPLSPPFVIPLSLLSCHFLCYCILHPFQRNSCHNWGFILFLIFPMARTYYRWYHSFIKHFSKPLCTSSSVLIHRGPALVHIFLISKLVTWQPNSSLAICHPFSTQRQDSELSKPHGSASHQLKIL